VKPTSAATSFYKAASNANGRINRRPLAAANHKYPVAVNASLEIWEIQRELKRGEMVQVRTTLQQPSCDIRNANAIKSK
jgi:hypothetical protein